MEALVIHTVQCICSTTVLYVPIASWWATTQLLIILTSRTFRPEGLCQLLTRHQLWASTTSQLSHAAPYPSLLPSSQSAHPQRLSAEEAHKVLKSDIPSGTNPVTFINLCENIENLKAFAVDASKAMPLTQITTMLLSWETVHMKWEPYMFCVKSVLLCYLLVGVWREWCGSVHSHSSHEQSHHHQHRQPGDLGECCYHCTKAIKSECGCSYPTSMMCLLPPRCVWPHQELWVYTAGWPTMLLTPSPDHLFSTKTPIPTMTGLCTARCELKWK